MPESQNPLRISADFNHLLRGPVNQLRTAVALDTFGSIRDLCNAGVVLRDGLPLIAIDWSDEAENLEGHGHARFDALRRTWVVEFDELGVRYVPAGDRSAVSQFLCVSCRRDISAQVALRGLDGNCGTCGTAVQAPIAPPTSSAAM
jgi:hypothetical protein